MDMVQYLAIKYENKAVKTKQEQHSLKNFEATLKTL